MRVILFFQHRVRELQACEQLARELDSRGVTASIYNIDFELATAALSVRRRGADAIVLPWLYHQQNYELLAPFLSANPDIVIINVHQEQLGSPVSIRVLLPKGDAAKNSALHYVWGDAFKNALINSGVAPHLIRVTGSMRNDFSLESLHTKQVLAERYHLDPAKRWILIAESRGWVLSDSPAFRADFVRQGYTPTEAEEFADVTKRSLEATVAELDALEAGFLPDCEIIYRPHPGTLSNTFENPRIRVITEEGIHHWLANIDLICVWNSTTIYEAEMHGVPGVAWSPVPNPPQHAVVGLERFPQITHFTEVADLLATDPKSTRFFVDLFGPDDKQSIARIADAIERDVANPPVGYRAEPVAFSLHLARKLLFEKLTEISVRIGVLARLKWPHSAYSHRGDIPDYGKRPRRI